MPKPILRDRIVLQVEVDRTSEHVLPAVLVRDALQRHVDHLQACISRKDGPAESGEQIILGVGRVRWQYLGSEEVDVPAQAG